MGDSPVPVGDPPTGMARTFADSEPGIPAALCAALVPSGESPDGTGQWPVLPAEDRALGVGEFLVAAVVAAGVDQFLSNRNVRAGRILGAAFTPLRR